MYCVDVEVDVVYKEEDPFPYNLDSSMYNWKITEWIQHIRGFREFRNLIKEVTDDATALFLFFKDEDKIPERLENQKTIGDYINQIDSETVQCIKVDHVKAHDTNRTEKV